MNTSSKKRTFFLKNGKQLKNTINEYITTPDESITGLIDFSQPTVNTPQVTINKKEQFLNFVKNTSKSLPKNINTKHMWMGSSLTAFIFLAVMFLVFPWKAQPITQDKYSIYASTPLTLKNMSYSIYTKDSRSQKINSVFKKYKCPLEGLGEVFVYEADKYNIPWWLVAAVSFQESGCGKKTPEPSGLESYNAWGWAVYGDNVQTFDNWARGIETVSEYMSNRFYKKGITDTCDIMKTYTPPSQGSWCEGVKYFGNEIQNYTSSDTPEIDSL